MTAKKPTSDREEALVFKVLKQPKGLVAIAVSAIVVIVIVVAVTATGGDTSEKVMEKPSPTARVAEESKESSPTAQVTEESSDATPTVEEALARFIACDRLRANMSMLWGQAPGVIYSGDPAVTGDIEEGDYVRFLMAEPTDAGAIRVKVFPHDGRAVGNSNDQVWIDWNGLVQFRLDQVMFICES